MCTGVEVAALAGTAASLAGTGVGIAGAKASADAQEQSIRNQLLQQQAFQDEATPLFAKSLEASNQPTATREIEQGAQNAADMYRRLQQNTFSAASPSVELSQQNKSLTDRAIQGQNKAQAGLQGYQDLAFQQWLKNQDTQLGLGTIGNLSRSSAMNAGTLAQLAGRSGAGLQGAGSLLTSLGGLASLYAATSPKQQTDLSGGYSTQIPKAKA